MSEIVNMSQKIRILLGQLTNQASAGERAFMEMLATYIYTEAFKDGYAKGYAEALTEAQDERNDNEL